MNRQNRPAYWQLDIFMGAMIGLAVVIMRAKVGSGWVTSAEIAWSALMIVGMSMWVRANWASLQREEYAQRGRQKHRHVPSARAFPLTPVQERYLAVMEQIETDDTIVVREK
jgi:hypothetical protein